MDDIKYLSRKDLGDIAVASFVEWADENQIIAVPYGIESIVKDENDRRKFTRTANAVRYMPDFLCYGNRPFFVEIKCGKSIDKDAYDSYMKWNNIAPLFIYVWDHSSKYGERHYLTQIDKIKLMNKKTSLKPEEYIDDYWRHSASNINSDIASGGLYAVFSIKSMNAIR